MKKVVTIFILFFFVCCYVKAQTVVFFEPFDELPSYSITGWGRSFSGAVPWQSGISSQLVPCMSGYMADEANLNKIAAICDCKADIRAFPQNDSNVLTYTPAIHMASVSGAWLKYDSYFEKYVLGSDTEKATVEISTDSGVTWTVIQNVPANLSLGSFSTYYIDLSAYDHTPNIWIGFRYRDDGGGFMMGWAVDNVEVFVPAHKDIAMLAVTPTDSLQRYVVLNNTYTHSGTVFNAGLDTIHAFYVKYQQMPSGIVYTDSVVGVNIPKYSSYSFIHNVPDTITSTGITNIRMWAELIGDTIHYNDSAKTKLQGAYFKPSKLLAIEDGEGTWNGYSPKCWVYMNKEPTTDINAALITIHDHDTMAVYDYDEYLYYLHWDYIPYILVDRRKIIIDSFFSVIRQRKDDFGFADLNLNGSMDGDSLTVNIELKPAIDLTGDNRLILVLTEDNVGSNDRAFQQVNAFAGGTMGAMGGFELKPDTVLAKDMYYNFVARKVVPSPGGAAGALPVTLVHNTTYHYSLGAKLDSKWDINKVKAIVLLYRNDDSTILNSSELSYYLNINKKQNITVDAGVYPNPASTFLKVWISVVDEGKGILSITDLTGALLYKEKIMLSGGRNEYILPVNQFSNGFYLINIISETNKRTLKLEIMH